MKSFKSILTNVGIGILVVVIVGLCFWEKPNQVALNFVSLTLEEAGSSLLLLTELKIAAAAGATVKIPLVSGSFAGVESVIDESLQYLEWSNMLLSLQLLLLTISKSIVLKLLVIISIVFVFFKKSKIIAIRLLIVFLLINPGLSIYTIGIKVINQETKIDLGTELNQELKKSHTAYLAKKKDHETKLQTKKDEQLKKAQKKGKDKISLLNRIEDDVEKVVYKVEDEVSLAFNDTLAVLKSAGQKVIQLCLNLFTHILFLFLILPMGYYYLMKYFISHLFLANTNANTNKNSNANATSKNATT